MFLPWISAFLLAGAAALAWPPNRGVGGQDNPNQPKATVVAGTGEVAADWVERTRMAVEVELPRLLPLFAGRPKHSFFVHVHADRDSMPAALVASLHEDCPAFAVLGQHQIHIVWQEMRRVGANLHGVVRHELVHELLDQFVAPNGRTTPRWFHEGLAQHLAGDTYLGASEDDLVWRIVARRLPSFGALRERFPDELMGLRAAYAQSYSYVSWLVREFGLADLLAVARAADNLTTFERALVGRLERSTLQLEEGWRHYVLHGSGAPWRVAFDQCFSLCLLAILPMMAFALMRRLKAERRVAEHLVAVEARNAAAAVAAAAAAAEQAERLAAEALPFDCHATPPDQDDDGHDDPNQRP